MRRRTFLFGASAVPLAVAGSKLPFTKIPEAQAAQRVKKDFSWRSYFPNVELQTHINKTVRFYDDLIKGKIAIINMTYTRCPDTCVEGTPNLVKVQKGLGSRVGRDIFIYSITLEPEHDTPKVLNMYARKHGVKPGWLFLTGKPEDVALLGESLGFAHQHDGHKSEKVAYTGIARIVNDKVTLITMGNVRGSHWGIVQKIWRHW